MSVVFFRVSINGSRIRISPSFARYFPGNSTAGIIPILRLRIIKPEPDALLATGLRQLFQYIFSIGSRIHDIPLTSLWIKHCKAIVMLGSDHDIFHACIFGHSHPFIGIKFYRVEFFCELLVISNRDFSPVHDPFSDTVDLLPLICSRGNRIYSPMNEHAKASFPPPFHTLIIGVCLCIQWL